VKQEYLDTISRLHPGKAFEKREWDFLTNTGRVEVNVIRGDLFEKACVSSLQATVNLPERDYISTVQWLGVATFPTNPLVPAFIGVFEHVSEKGLEHCPGFYDIYPTIEFAEDKEYVRTELMKVATKHGREYEDLIKGYRRMFRLKEADIGIGYGVGMSFGPDEEDSQYFEACAYTILQAYFYLVERRRDTKPTTAQIEEMFRKRAERTQWTFNENRFYQGGIMLGVPPESFILHMLPPW